MCFKVVYFVGKDIFKVMEMDNEGIIVGVVCVYFNRVVDCVKYFKVVNCFDISVVLVVIGFFIG